MAVRAQHEIPSVMLPLILLQHYLITRASRELILAAPAPHRQRRRWCHRGRLRDAAAGFLPRESFSWPSRGWRSGAARSVASENSHARLDHFVMCACGPAENFPADHVPAAAIAVRHPSTLSAHTLAIAAQQEKFLWRRIVRACDCPRIECRAVAQSSVSDRIKEEGEQVCHRDCFARKQWTRNAVNGR